MTIHLTKTKQLIRQTKYRCVSFDIKQMMSLFIGLELFGILDLI
jgi:hypothetical protein